MEKMKNICTKEKNKERKEERRGEKEKTNMITIIQ